MLTQTSTPVPIRIAKKAIAGIIIVSAASVAATCLARGLQFEYQIDVETSLARVASITAPAKAHAAEVPKKAKKKETKKAYFIKPAQGIDWGVIHSHNGVDIANTCGTSIVAAADGTVKSVDTGWNGGYGTAVLIRHGNGTETYYAHMAKVLVEAGDKVEQGEKLGTIGLTGKTTGCHVHFEVHGGVNPFGK